MISRLTRFRTAAVSLTLFTLAAVAVGADPPISLERVSVSTAELEEGLPSYGTVGSSSDGRFVVFTSNAEEWLPVFARNFQPDVWVRDRKTGVTELVSVATSTITSRAVGNGRSFLGSISDDGRYVAFVSAATNFAGTAANADNNNATDVFLRDRRGRTTRVSVSTGNGQANGASTNPQISGNAEFIVFQSDATNLVADANASTDVFIHQRDTSGFGFFGITDRISEDSVGIEADGPSRFPSVSADGRYVAFESEATNLDPNGGDTSPNVDIYVKDTFTGEVQLVSVADDGTPGDGDSTVPAISADGQYVAFVSTSENLVLDDTNLQADVFVRDLINGTTVRVSVDTDGIESPDMPSGIYAADPVLGRPAISADGNLVAFVSDAAFDLDDFNDAPDIYVRNIADETTSRASITSGGVEGDAASVAPALTPDGAILSFQSDATNLADDDTNGSTDVFVATIGESTLINLPPVPDAGADLSVTENSAVQLDASGSTDPNGDALSYSWRQIEGPAVALSNATSVNPTFTAPLVLDFETLVFEVAVSDGTNAPITATVNVDVSAAPPGVLFGSVGDLNGNAIEGAEVSVVRDDGSPSEPVFTDLNGNYAVFDVRAGRNTITVTAPGFEPTLRLIDMPEQGLLGEDFKLQQATTILRGVVRLADGSPHEDALVELLDATGTVLDETVTDADGSYLFDTLNRFDLISAVTLRISKPSYIDLIESAAGLSESVENVRDFRYGRLVVLVDTKPASLRRKLNGPNGEGTKVDVLIGDKIVATNFATFRVRRLIFPNVPATTVKIRAVNQDLTASQVLQRVGVGPRPTNVTIRLLKKGVF